MKKISKYTFYLYTIFLIWMILFKFVPVERMLATTREINLIPFAASGGIIEILVNVLAFIPFGIMLAVTLKKNFVVKLGLVFLLSLSFETFQFIFAIGVSDITDIMTNTFGGFVGLLIYQLWTKGKEEREIKKIENVITLLVGLIIVFIAIFLGQAAIRRWG